MIVHKVLSKSYNSNLSLILNTTPLKLQQTVKYLGLSIQLARYTKIFYRIRNFVPKETLHMLYHSRILSRIQYGILIW